VGGFEIRDGSQAFVIPIRSPGSFEQGSFAPQKENPRERHDEVHDEVWSPKEETQEAKGETYSFVADRI
jgi:hypothetical protein